MIKLEQSSGSGGVKIAAGIEAFGLRRSELLQRSRRAMRQLGWQLAGLRMAHARDGTFELQQFIPGVLAMRIVAAWQGRVLAGVSLLTVCVNPPPFGASTVVRLFDHPEMEATACGLVAALGFSGFACFDFIIEENGGDAFVIELNPRTVRAIHLGRLFGHDLCGALARHLAWRTETPEQATIPKETAIALFPTEMERDPESTWLRSGSGALHDVPWDDPRVIEHYYRKLLQLHPGHAFTMARLLRFNG
jgi:hypothetical protein